MNDAEAELTELASRHDWALANMGTMLQVTHDYTDRLTAVIGALESEWSGRTADAVVTYFRHMRSQFEGLRGYLNDVSLAIGGVSELLCVAGDANSVRAAEAQARLDALPSSIVPSGVTDAIDNGLSISIGGVTIASNEQLAEFSDMLGSQRKEAAEKALHEVRGLIAGAAQSLASLHWSGDVVDTTGLMAGAAIGAALGKIARVPGLDEDASTVSPAGPAGTAETSTAGASFGSGAHLTTSPVAADGVPAGTDATGGAGFAAPELPPATGVGGADDSVLQVDSSLDGVAGRAPGSGVFGGAAPLAGPSGPNATLSGIGGGGLGATGLAIGSRLASGGAGSAFGIGARGAASGVVGAGGVGGSGSSRAGVSGVRGAGGRASASGVSGASRGVGGVGARGAVPGVVGAGGVGGSGSSRAGVSGVRGAGGAGGAGSSTPGAAGRSGSGRPGATAMGGAAGASGDRKRAGSRGFAHAAVPEFDDDDMGLPAAASRAGRREESGAD
ncbi:hypothetical protein [Microbacterium sp.]|uniref:hypothetical protein n=1 Tax=Microbacterium sp. TaxID=51671 RepID=UPI003A8C8045